MSSGLYVFQYMTQKRQSRQHLPSLQRQSSSLPPPADNLVHPQPRAMGGLKLHGATRVAFCALLLCVRLLNGLGDAANVAARGANLQKHRKSKIKMKNPMTGLSDRHMKKFHQVSGGRRPAGDESPPPQRQAVRSLSTRVKGSLASLFRVSLSLSLAPSHAFARSTVVMLSVRIRSRVATAVACRGGRAVGLVVIGQRLIVPSRRGRAGRAGRTSRGAKTTPEARRAEANSRATPPPLVEKALLVRLAESITTCHAPRSPSRSCKCR